MSSSLRLMQSGSIHVSLPPPCERRGSYYNHLATFSAASSLFFDDVGVARLYSQQAFSSASHTLRLNYLMLSARYYLRTFYTGLLLRCHILCFAMCAASTLQNSALRMRMCYLSYSPYLPTLSSLLQPACHRSKPGGMARGISTEGFPLKKFSPNHHLHVYAGPEAEGLRPKT